MFKPILIAIAILLCFAIFVLLGKSKRPKYKKKNILTANELEFFYRLRRALPDHYIFPQVAFSALLEPTNTNPKSYKYDFARIAQKRVDYAIYTSEMRLVAIVELDDKSHRLKKVSDSDRDAYFKSAGITTLRYISKQKPSELELAISVLKVEKTAASA